jgi:hypothetical protein
MAEGKFVRVSTARQGRSGLGLEAQRKAVEDFLNGGNWQVVKEFVEADRPQLEKAFQLCRLMSHSGGAHGPNHWAVRRSGDSRHHCLDSRLYLGAAWSIEEMKNRRRDRRPQYKILSVSFARPRRRRCLQVSRRSPSRLVLE